MKATTAELVAEREALESLLKSDGWAVFTRHVEREWSGAGYFSRMGTALNTNDPVAPKVVHATSLEIGRILKAVEQRVIKLKGIVE